MLDKTYDPKDIEAAVTPSGRLASRARPDRQAVLHRHPAAQRHRLRTWAMVNNTLQDILTARHMKGDDTLWRRHRPCRHRTRWSSPASSRRRASAEAGQTPRANQTLLNRDGFLARVWE